MKKNKVKIILSLFALILFLGLATGALGQTALENPLGNVNNPLDLYARLIYAFMGTTGVVALLMFVIGGLEWMTAGGAAEKVKKGKDTLLWAVLGLILIFASYAILRIIFETLKF